MKQKQKKNNFKFPKTQCCGSVESQIDRNLLYDRVKQIRFRVLKNDSRSRGFWFNDDLRPSERRRNRRNRGSSRKTKKKKKKKKKEEERRIKSEERRGKGTSGSWTLTRSCFSAIWVEAGAKQMVGRNTTETKERQRDREREKEREEGLSYNII